jgi:hypothetical protein
MAGAFAAAWSTPKQGASRDIAVHCLRLQDWVSLSMASRLLHNRDVWKPMGKKVVILVMSSIGLDNGDGS